MQRQVLVVVIMPLIWIATTATPIVAEEAAKAQAELTRRVEKLESVVIRDPFRPRNAVLARLDTIEATLAERRKAETDAARQRGRDDVDLRRTLDAITKQMSRIETRLDALERNTVKGTGDTRKLDTLQRDLDTAKRTLKTLEDRVRRLESSR